MTIPGDRILALISHYGKVRGYAEKSYLTQFTEENELNYGQWSNYTRNAQSTGPKVLEAILKIFPEINLNWLIKGEGEMFLNDGYKGIAEPAANYSKASFETEVLQRLEALQIDMKSLKDGYKMSDN